MILFARLIVGGVLLAAGFLKAVGPVEEFAAMIEAYKIIPPALAMQAALYLPYLEMGLGLALILGFETRRCAALSAGFFLVFIVAILSTFVRGIDLVSCGCFGADALSPKVTIYLDVVFLLLSLAIFRWSTPRDRYSLDQWLN